MDLRTGDGPLFWLVDDDEHSAHFFARTLAGVQSEIRIDHHPSPDRALRRLADLLETDAALPDMIVVDLKAHTGVNEKFLAHLRAALRGREIPVVVMARSLEHKVRAPLIAAGADAVFDRSADLTTYRQEVAALLEFWRRGRPRIVRRA
ncbi:MAG TPA: hypothetical protein VIL84_06055 [Devosiaceae bacterium]